MFLATYNISISRQSRSTVVDRIVALRSFKLRSEIVIVHSQNRSGAILVWFALILITLLGMVGLVIDTGLLMSGRRQAQNAADAAALAAAYELMFGNSSGAATDAANTYVGRNKDLSANSNAVVNIPPSNGPYSGMPNYVEVIVSIPKNTYFIHILPGVSQSQTVSGAGWPASSPYRLEKAWRCLIQMLDPAWPSVAKCA